MNFCHGHSRHIVPLASAPLMTHCARCDDEGESSPGCLPGPGRPRNTGRSLDINAESRKTLIIIITHSALILIDRQLDRTLSTLSCQDTQINGKGLHTDI